MQQSEEEFDALRRGTMLDSTDPRILALALDLAEKENLGLVEAIERLYLLGIILELFNYPKEKTKR